MKPDADAYVTQVTVHLDQSAYLLKRDACMSMRVLAGMLCCPCRCQAFCDC
jgi:hypothetical protein